MEQDFIDLKDIKKIELVAPAGNWNQLKAAIKAGANAVYLAYKKYGARAYVENFDIDNLKKATYFAHLNNIKVYLAVNTLIKEKELNEFLDFIYKIVTEINIDSLIVQDFAVVKIIKEIYPKIALHASTQLNIHNSTSLQFLKDFNFKRAILAREMTLSELKKITLKNIMDIEIFCHGSQCYSYSGQCYFSSFTGQRSGNRGTCPQPCRMKYELIKEKSKEEIINVINNNNYVNVNNYQNKNNNFNKLKNKKFEITNELYFLSKSDLITIFYLPEIINLGIKALKIEGRMKTPEYVGIVTKIYRKYIDLYYENPKNFFIDDNDIYKLKQIFSREISEGYLNNKFPENIISIKKSGNVGTYFGRIIKIDFEVFKNKSYKVIYIKSSYNLFKNDVLEFWTKKGNERIVINEYKIDSKDNNKYIYKISINKNIDVNLNDRVFKYFDYELDKEAKSLYLYDLYENNNIKENSSLNQNNQNNEVNVENYKKLKLELTDNLNNKESIKKVDNFSICLFAYNDQKINLQLFLNNLTNIINKKNNKYPDDLFHVNFLYEDSKNLFLDNNYENLKKIFNFLKQKNINNLNFFIITPNIIYDEQLNNFEKILIKLIDLGITNFYVSNPAIIFLLNKISNLLSTSLNLIIGYNFNLFNSFAVNEIQEYIAKSNNKLAGVALSAELTLKEINNVITNINKNFNANGIKNDNFKIKYFYLYSYGFFPIMTARVNYKNILNDDNNNYYLKDLKNFKFKLSYDYLNNTQIFNSKKHCIIFDLLEIVNNKINGFLIDTKFLDTEEIYFIIKSFIDILNLIKNINLIDLSIKDKKSFNNLNYNELMHKYETLISQLQKSPFTTNYTKGHLFREVL